MRDHYLQFVGYRPVKRANRKAPQHGSRRMWRTGCDCQPCARAELQARGHYLRLERAAQRITRAHS